MSMCMYLLHCMVPYCLTMRLYISNPTSQLCLYYATYSDYDSDCNDGLICWYGDGSGTIPGCSGTPKEDWEYCVFQTVPMPPRNVTHSDTLVDFADNLGPGAYGRCQGDCGECTRLVSCPFILVISTLSPSSYFIFILLPTSS